MAGWHKLVILLGLCFLLSFAPREYHSALAPKFDIATMRFQGSRPQQARYLLRHVFFQGRLSDTLRVLPPLLDSMMNETLAVPTRDELRYYLLKRQIDSMDVGGDISRPLSRTKSGVEAGYFIIHDASNLMNPPTVKSFSPIVNSIAWEGNQIWRQRNFRWAHAFINRLGESVTCNDFEKPIYATKFEKSIQNPDVGDTCVGNFIHIENIMPRRSSRRKRPYNDAIAINPGLTELQYERLALLYLVASIRREAWLIPSFHAVIDEGIRDAHTDPQNFELLSWVKAVRRVYQSIRNS